MELQTTTSLIASLNHPSFCRRQLKELDSAAAVLSYGSKLLDSDSDLLPVFEWCAVEILGEAKSSSTAGSAGCKETIVLTGEVRSAADQVKS